MAQERTRLLVIHSRALVLTTLSFQHDGNLPKTLAEKKEFKASILAMRIKPDEENFEEAEAQA